MSEFNLETQSSISAWGEETFGPVASASVLVERARLEFDELAEAVGQMDNAAVGHEIADILILLYRVATLHGCDVDEMVQAKMRINRGREWVRTGDGTGRHVKR